MYHVGLQSLRQSVLEYVRKHELLKAGDRLGAAVSGGADSVALFRLLLELRGEIGLVLSVVHFNHKLRGEESDEDERFVAELARTHKLEFHCKSGEVKQYAAEKRLSLETAARELRYEFFRELLKDRHLNRIATGHTLDDQAETVLLRIFRGTGIRGLSGIHPRIVFENEGCAFGEVVRPLLGFRRAELLTYLRDIGQDWREDSSNQNVDFLRNRVRHRLLPVVVEEFGDATIERLSELAEIARAEEQWAASIQYSVPSIQSGTVQPSLNVDPLLTLPLAVQRRLVRGWLKENAPGLRISFRLIEEALELAWGPAGRQLELPGGWSLRRGRQELLLELAAQPGRGKAADYQYSLVVPGVVEVRELGACIEAQLVDAVAVPEQERGQLLDAARLPKQIVIRNWRPGDCFWPAHTKSEKKVKELLSDRHVTGAEKKCWPVAVVDGRLVWLKGFATPAALGPPAGVSQAIWIRQMPV